MIIAVYDEKHDRVIHKFDTDLTDSEAAKFNNIIGLLQDLDYISRYRVPVACQSVNFVDIGGEPTVVFHY